MNRLKQQIQEHSPVCAHAKISSQDLEKDPTLKWVFEEMILSDYSDGLIHSHQDM